jgi:hypothetical protein
MHNFTSARWIFEFKRDEADVVDVMVTLQTCILQVLSSNLNRDTKYRNGLRDFTQPF